MGCETESGREDGGVALRLARGCMASWTRLPLATASTVRSSVRTQSWTEQVAQLSGYEAMRLHPSPEQSEPAIYDGPSKLVRFSPLSVWVRMGGPHCDLCGGSGTTHVEQLRPALGWRCRCLMFRSSAALNGTSFGVEQLSNVVRSSRCAEAERGPLHHLDSPLTSAPSPSLPLPSHLTSFEQHACAESCKVRFLAQHGLPAD